MSELTDHDLLALLTAVFFAMPPPKPPTEARRWRVKAWLAVDADGDPYSRPSYNRPHLEKLWGPTRVVPCVITYTPPQRKAR